MSLWTTLLAPTVADGETGQAAQHPELEDNVKKSPLKLIVNVLSSKFNIFSV